jgi:hypothetical protein
VHRVRAVRVAVPSGRAGGAQRVAGGAAGAARAAQGAGGADRAGGARGRRRGGGPGAGWGPLPPPA